MGSGSGLALGMGGLYGECPVVWHFLIPKCPPGRNKCASQRCTHTNEPKAPQRKRLDRYRQGGGMGEINAEPDAEVNRKWVV